ncbi:MAG: aminotransferase class V-fold PLP-dependent enzyme [Nannocystaceae bacterium]|nr:aminotransferase class V-fold PLP-dependent enzyme [bacterium]
MNLDIEFVRAQFPGLESPWVLFDNAGGSVPAGAVIDRVTRYMRSRGVQLGASYSLSSAAEADVRAGEAAAALLLGASTQETIVSHSTTAGLGILAAGIGPTLTEGDEIVVTNLDHAANIGCWLRMAAHHGLVVREWKIRPDTARLETDDLAALLGPKTRLVAFTQCANVVGELIDVRRVADVIRDNRKDTIVVADGVAYAPHRHVDVEAMGVDVYATSLYKVYGPHLSAIYGRASLLREAQGQNHWFIADDRIPYKMQPGNVTHELTAGLTGITDYLDAVAAHHDIRQPATRARHAAVFERFAAQEATLCARMLEGLLSHDAVSVVGPHDPSPAIRVPTIAFTVKDRHASEIPPLFDAHHIGLRYGDFYAPGAIDALGLAERGGVVRASLVHYNTLDEVDRFLSVLREVL